MKRSVLLARAAVLGLLVVFVTASAAGACGSLVAANGAVNLVRTTTLAAYHDGVEHYVTSFEFTGVPKTFGSIIPLPDKPSNVERAGDWTLQRLEREVNPPLVNEGFAATSALQADKVEIIQQVRIDSLDVTILRGGGKAVAKWANEQGFDLTHDAPAVLDFYAQRSPYFMAAKFDASAAVAAGFQGGDGIPVHLAIPTDNPWVPLRILGAAKVPQAPVNADVFLLTDHKPSLLYGKGFSIVQSERASHHVARRPPLRRALGRGCPRMGGSPTAGSSGRADEVLTDLAIDVHGDDAALRDTGAEYRRGLVLDTVPLPAPGPSAAWTVAAVAAGVVCARRASAWPSATSTTDSTAVFACVDRTHAVKRSIPLITCPQRTDWNPSNACCAPGSSAYATGSRDTARSASTK